MSTNPPPATPQQEANEQINAIQSYVNEVVGLFSRKGHDASVVVTLINDIQLTLFDLQKTLDGILGASTTRWKSAAQPASTTSSDSGIGTGASFFIGLVIGAVAILLFKK